MKLHSTIFLFILWFGALFAAKSAWAGETTIGLEIGPEYLDGELFFYSGASVQYDAEQLTGELDIPLRWSVGQSGGQVLRKEDWDSLSDAGRVIRKIDYTLEERGLVFHAGVIGRKSIGHGTLVYEFSNALLPEEQPVGMEARVVIGPWVVETMAANVLGWGVMAASIFVEPLTVAGYPNDRVHLLFSGAVDGKAIPESSGKRLLVYGVGMDGALIRDSTFQLVPYFDINSTAKGGHGLHGGVLASWTLRQCDLSWRAEWRRTSGRYQPEYFDFAYTVERESTSENMEGEIIPSSKSEISNPAAHSWRTEVRVQLENTSLSASLSARRNFKNSSTNQLGYDAAATLQSEISKIEVAGFVALRTFEWGHNPGRIFLQAEARYRINPFFYVWATGGQLYRVEGSDSLRYPPNYPVAVRFFSGGIGCAFGLE